MPSDAEGKPGSPEKPSLPNLGASVPVFNCVVNVSPTDDGGVQARVANLAGLDCTAGSEREALAKIVAAFKAHVSKLTHDATPIPWIDPPVAADANEQVRYIPVHL
jgi:hypothetical protein